MNTSLTCIPKCWLLGTVGVSTVSIGTVGSQPMRSPGLTDVVFSCVEECLESTAGWVESSRKTRLSGLSIIESPVDVGLRQTTSQGCMKCYRETAMSSSWQSASSDSISSKPKCHFVRLNALFTRRGESPPTWTGEQAWFGVWWRYTLVSTWMGKGALPEWDTWCLIQNIRQDEKGFNNCSPRCLPPPSSPAAHTDTLTTESIFSTQKRDHFNIVSVRSDSDPCSIH